MEINSKRKLSHNSLEHLINYDFKENQKEYFVNIILQLYKCVPILNREYFSCSLFDDEYICNKFIIKCNKNEIPYPGDILCITKIKINILDDENLFYFCEEIEILEKGAKFLINPDNLKNISSKQKKFKLKNNENIIPEKKEKNLVINENKNLEIFNGENNINENLKIDEQPKNINKENIFINKENKEINKEEEKNEKIIDNSYKNIDLNIFNNNEIGIEKNNNLDVNKTILQIQNIIDNNYNKENINIQSKKLIKIEPHKKDTPLNSKEILDITYKVFREELKDLKNPNSKKLTMSLKNLNRNEEKQDYQKTQIQLKVNKPNTKKNFRYIFNRIIKGGLNIKYIEDIRKYIKNYNIDTNYFRVNIKCRIKNFFHSDTNYYLGCSECHKKIKNNKICCKNGKERFFYNFHLNVRDASGVISICFYNKEGEAFIGMNANTYKQLIENQNVWDNNDFNGQEYLFTIKFEKCKSKESRKEYKYTVCRFEKVKEKHFHQLANELKSILGIK